jgi:nicotinate-nucleotide adenylyltransferase
MNEMIGVYGGTFDPIHFGHLRPALDVVEAFKLEKCHFIPCSIPHHRMSPSASSEQRLEMVAAGIAAENRFILDSREINRNGISYTVDTLESIRNEVKHSKILCLIIGIDVFIKFGQWHRWNEILSLCHIIVTHRPGWDAAQILGSNQMSAELSQVIKRNLVTKEVELKEIQSGKIIFQSVTQLDISATKVRKLLAAKKSIQYLVPDEVIKIIKNQNIYVK